MSPTTTYRNLTAGYIPDYNNSFIAVSKLRKAAVYFIMSEENSYSLFCKAHKSASDCLVHNCWILRDYFRYLVRFEMKREYIQPMHS